MKFKKSVWIYAFFASTLLVSASVAETCMTPNYRFVQFQKGAEPNKMFPESSVVPLPVDSSLEIYPTDFDRPGYYTVSITSDDAPVSKTYKWNGSSQFKIPCGSNTACDHQINLDRVEEVGITLIYWPCQRTDRPFEDPPVETHGVRLPVCVDMLEPEFDDAEIRLSVEAWIGAPNRSSSCPIVYSDDKRIGFISSYGFSVR